MYVCPSSHAAVVSVRLPVGAHRHGKPHETNGSKYLGIAHDDEKCSMIDER